MTRARLRVSTAIRKAITPTTAPSIQKTSVGFSNLRAGDQWEQEGRR